MTVAVPADPDVVVHVMDVDDTTVTEAHDEEPIETVAPWRNPVPVIVTATPPVFAPVAGEIDETVGGGTKVNKFVPVPDCESELVTTMFAVPAEPAGVVQVKDVADTTVIDEHADPPIVTVTPAAKPVPLTVIDVPPPIGPDVGDTDVTVGAGLEMLNAVIAPVAVPLQ